MKNKLILILSIMLVLTATAAMAIDWTANSTNLIRYYHMNDTTGGVAVDVINGVNPALTSVTLNTTNYKIDNAAYQFTVAGNILGSDWMGIYANNATFNMWVYFDNNSYIGTVMFSHFGNCEAITCFVFNSSSSLVMSLNGVNKTFAFITPITNNAWHMLTVIQNVTASSNTRAYIDGVESSSGVQTGIPTGSYEYLVGRWSAYDDLSVFQRILSASDISNLYNGGWGLEYNSNSQLYNLNLTLYDENTNNLITQNMTIIIASDTYSNTSYIISSSIIYGLPNGTYKIRIYNANYSERDYFITLNANTNIIARLSTNNSLYNFYVKDINKNTIQNAIIIVQRQYTGSYVTIGQCTSNLVGLCQLNLIPAQEYKFIISANGYQTLTTNYVMTPELNNTAIYLSPSNNNDAYTYYYGNLSYTISPFDNLIMLNGSTLVSFILTTSCPSGCILWTATSYNNSIVNITGSPSGGSANLTLDFSNVSTSAYFDINYSFRDSHASDFYTITYHYYVYNGSFYPSTLPSALNAFGGDFSAVWKAIVATFIILVAGLLMNSLFGIPGISVIASLGVAIFFAAEGWLSIAYVSIMVVIIIVTFFIAGRAS